MWEIPVHRLTLVTGADLSTKQFHAVKVDAAGEAVLAGAGENAIGILQDYAEDGQAATVMVLGVTRAYLGGVVASGANVTPDANGKLVTAGGGDAVIGICLEGGTTGELRPVELATRTSSGLTGLANAYTLLQIPVTLAGADDDVLLTDWIPGFAGKVVGLQYIAHVPASTADKTASITVTIDGVATTGGVLSLATATVDAIGDVVEATAITDLNTFAADSVISLVAANTGVPFIEGSGTLVLRLEQ